MEPDEDHDSRFAFTMPLSLGKQAFHVWGIGGERFCMPATQVCAVLKIADAGIHRDSRGEHILTEGRPVPVLKLSLLCSGAPEHGDRIVIAGSLEKRVAFYVRGSGNVEEGMRQKISIPSWRTLTNGVAQLEDGRIPVVEAATILQRYLEVLSDGYDERPPGAIADDRSEPAISGNP
ncbi:MAG: chemotaxis protein CheW [Chitinivibrionia bacterium]|nr:chemotaxis protein CheW [Chitinivibrionia bacterium]